MTVEHAVADLLHGDGRQRRIGRGLPQRTIAAHRRDHGVPGPHRHREVERADDADDAEGMPLLIHAMARPLAVHGQAIQLARETHGKVGHVDHLLHFALAFGADLAHLHGDQRAEVGFRAAQLIGHLAHDLAAFGRGNHAPFAEGLGGVRGYLLIVVAPRHAHARDDGAIRRVYGGQFAAGGLGNPIAVARAGIDRLNFQSFQNFVCRCRHERPPPAFPPASQRLRDRWRIAVRLPRPFAAFFR